MRKYDHLFFDLDNTLYDFTTNAYYAIKDALDKLGILEQMTSFDDFIVRYQEINEGLWADYREKKITKQFLRGERFARSLGEFGLKFDMEPTAIDDAYLEIMPTKTAMFPNTIEVLEELKKRGYQMHIITNGFIEVQHKKMKNTGLDKYIGKVFISEELKAPKPARQIFEHAVKSTNSKKVKSIMIGDSWESDIVGAQNFGMDQIFFNIDNFDFQQKGCTPPTHVITELSELLEIL